MSDSRQDPITPTEVVSALPEAHFEWQRSKFDLFLEENYKKLLVGLALLGAAVAGYFIVQQRQEEKQTVQGEAFAAAKNADGYRQVIREHPGTTAAGSAQFMLANLLSKEKKVGDALSELQTFTGQNPDHPLQELAKLKEAMLRLEQGNTDEGITKLADFAANYPDSAWRSVAIIRRADALVSAGKIDEARKVYEDLSADARIAGTPAFTQVKDRLNKLKLKAPDLVDFVPEPTADAPSTSAPTPIQGLNIPGLDAAGGLSSPAGKPIEIKLDGTSNSTSVPIPVTPNTPIIPADPTPKAPVPAEPQPGLPSGN